MLQNVTGHRLKHYMKTLLLSDINYVTSHEVPAIITYAFDYIYR